MVALAARMAWNVRSVRGMRVAIFAGNPRIDQGGGKRRGVGTANTKRST